MTGPTHARPLRVALPWWDDALREACDMGEPPALSAMPWLEARARSVGPGRMPWREWLAAGEGFDDHWPVRWPAGPCLAALSGAQAVGGVHWAVARPVHLATAIDHLRLAPLQSVALTPEEADRLRDSLNAYLSGSGYELRPGTSADWCLHCVDAVDCATFDPASAVGRNLRDFLPSGRDGRTLRSLMNDMQMVLHEHPVNEARARSGQLAANAIWIWGFGPVVAPGRRELSRLATDDTWLAGLWTLHGERTGAQLPADSVTDASLVGWATPPAGSPAHALAGTDAGLLESLRRQLASGQRGSAEVHTGERVIVLDRWSRWRAWRRPRPIPAVTA